ncbi:acetolactate synthase, large subunit, biosynthetic type [Candidatus Poribacteria bacterium]|jgi:acetolactate synthase-1/2/3 large subunit|nr:acetolactate synthase, large subunit, biosynthetic type [Candidatus Poribacteria bacterium]MDP6595844.1 biosynthetic-type acetolactate synthase large subunit [Candidatus Poribacteria bacterium]MDP6745798.1 biosynthetic-type acetolactate synthase large subunit [Candidatus Poribacteria bacterium]MDP6995094.1 biosynthetic-type acetolactate synthase large subunit [Candidatus Poribacteria bacterium]
MKNMRGAKILVESLKRAEVKYIFGVQGGAAMPIFDDLYDAEGLKLIPMRHEQGAAHAADGYARATGKVGVTLATSGPGATNLVTGIATAHMDSIPMVAITGQVPTYLMGNDAFQECDILGITRPICKHSYLIKSSDEVADVVAEAFHVAATGKPGPVVIDFAKDAQIQESAFYYPESVNIRSYNPTVVGHPGQIKKAMDLINRAEKPMIYAGGGVTLANAHEELRHFTSKTGIPITVTLMGLGAFPETDPLAMRMPGMHGSCCANYAFSDADLVIAIGARFDDRVTGNLERFSQKSKKIHIDIDPSSIGKNVTVDIPIVGDAKNILRDMNKLAQPAQIEPWMQQIREWQKKYPFEYRQNGDRVMPQYVIEQVYDLFPDAVVTADVGQHQMWAAQYFKYTEHRQWLNSGGLGTMGFSLPATIGAQLGRPDKTLVNINGDGSFIMNIQELVPAVTMKLPLKIFIINNMYLGMVRQWQEMFFQKRYSAVDYHDNPDFAKLAEGFGATGIRVERPEEVRPALEQAQKIEDGPVVIDFIVDEEENVFPMVPSGAGLDEVIRGLA